MAFVAIAEAVANMHISPLWAVLFYRLVATFKSCLDSFWDTTAPENLGDRYHKQVNDISQYVAVARGGQSVWFDGKYASPTERGDTILEEDQETWSKW